MDRWNEEEDWERSHKPGYKAAGLNNRALQKEGLGCILELSFSWLLQYGTMRHNTQNWQDFSSHRNKCIVIKTRRYALKLNQENNFTLFSFFWVTWHAGSQFPDQGWNPHPLLWGCRFLTTRLQEQSQGNYFKCLMLFSGAKKMEHAHSIIFLSLITTKISVQNT